jgi:hypothetical protein
MAGQLGEPMMEGFDPLALAADLAPLGLRLEEEDLDLAAMEARYFQGRNEKLLLPYLRRRWSFPRHCGT